jgi:hypothetical protein
VNEPKKRFFTEKEFATEVDASTFHVPAYDENFKDETPINLEVDEV